jgi:ubiquinone/menaquinone biosynthesis C-methylase UbiE
LKDLSPKKVLFIGGGDGSDYLEKQNEIQGEFWELSDSMLNRARKNLEKSGLSFHLGNFRSNQQFDLICLPFVLDTLPDQELDSFLFSFKKNLKPGGQVFLSDFFEPITFLQKILHQLMMSFFRFATGHRRKDVPDYESAFGKAGFKLSQEKKLLKGWVKTQLWESV